MYSASVPNAWRDFSLVRAEEHHNFELRSIQRGQVLWLDVFVVDKEIVRFHSPGPTPISLNQVQRNAAHSETRAVVPRKPCISPQPENVCVTEHSSISHLQKAAIDDIPRIACAGATVRTTAAQYPGALRVATIGNRAVPCEPAVNHVATHRAREFIRRRHGLVSILKDAPVTATVAVRCTVGLCGAHLIQRRPVYAT